MFSIFHGAFRITGCYLQNWGYWTPPRKPHTGLDLVGDADATIFSPAAGVVEHAGDAGDGFGIYVRIRAGNGRKHYLCHMASCAVKAGQTVKVGDKLGVMGHTGNVTGAHTHYEIRHPKLFGYDLESAAAFLGLPNKQGSYAYNPSAPAKPAPPAIVHIDTPKAGAIIAGDIQVRGWGLRPAGLSRADAWLDPTEDGRINLGTSGGMTPRPDVQKIYAGKGYANPGQSGIALNIPFAKLPKGRHTLGIAGIPADGSGPVWALIPIDIK